MRSRLFVALVLATLGVAAAPGSGMADVHATIGTNTVALPENGATFRLALDGTATRVPPDVSTVAPEMTSPSRRYRVEIGSDERCPARRRDARVRAVRQSVVARRRSPRRPGLARAPRLRRGQAHRGRRRQCPHGTDAADHEAAHRSAGRSHPRAVRIRRDVAQLGAGPAERNRRRLARPRARLSFRLSSAAQELGERARLVPRNPRHVVGHHVEVAGGDRRVRRGPAVDLEGRCATRRA